MKKSDFASDAPGIFIGLVAIVRRTRPLLRHHKERNLFLFVAR